METLRRAALLLVALSLALWSAPSPSRAVTTQQEIRAGQAEDEQITGSQVVETDPLLNAYVRSIAEKLWTEVARKDLPYNVKIIKASDINSFATEGGFIYIDEGLVDFVQSDDELASVIGHETGHIERRHVITLNSKAEVIEILAGLASIFSPFLMPATSLLGQTVIMKMSREDELEADRYGLQLMARAGYDPEAMVTMMQHMTVLAGDQSQLVDKYLQDHPDPQDRVAHLVGYPELDPKRVTPAELLVRADSDAERARYSYAAVALRNVLRKEPGDLNALLKLAHVEIALGLFSKSEQRLAQAERVASPQARALVALRERELRGIERRQVAVLGADPDYGRLSAGIAAARTELFAAAAQIETQRHDAHRRLQSLESRLNDVSQDIPNVGNPQANSPLGGVMTNLTAISRAVNSAFDDMSQVVDNVGSLAPGKSGGLLSDTRELLDEMAAPLAMRPVPADAEALLSSYPQMTARVARSEHDALRGVEIAESAMVQMESGLEDLEASMRALTAASEGFGPPDPQEIGAIAPRMQQALASFDAAATTASQAAQLYNMARARQLSARITLLGVGTSPERYATLQYALQQRFGMDGIDYATMVHDRLTPGDVTAATILAADVQGTPQAIIDEALRTRTPIVDLANEHGMHAWPLEIFMHLVYLDYTDDPVREMSVKAPAGSAGGG